MEHETTHHPFAGPIVYWLPTGVIFLAFMGSGIAMLVGVQPLVDGMLHLGYPPYFNVFLGIWKVLGAIVIVMPGLQLVKEWAYAGIMYDLTGAITSRLAVEDFSFETALPMIFIVATYVSWVMRPDDRRLSGTYVGGA